MDKIKGLAWEELMRRNALVAQSGGPSPVINASLLGVIEACRSYPDRIGSICAAWHGIEGVLLEELVDMGTQDEAELKYLKHTPLRGRDRHLPLQAEGRAGGQFPAHRRRAAQP